jgi:hypothetical protein
MENLTYTPEYETLIDKLKLVGLVTNNTDNDYLILLESLNIACKAIKCLDAETLQNVFNIKKPE